MDSARANYIADFAGRATLIVLFGFLATNKTMVIVNLLRDPAGPRFLDIAVTLAGIAFAVLVLGMTIMRFAPIRRAEGLEPRISAIAGTGLAMVIVVLPRADIGPGLNIFGLILIMIGWILSACVLLWLGRAFSVMAQARRLVTSGPYAIVRHPLYLSEEIAVLGVALIHLSVAAGLIVIVHWLFQLRRMTNEETVLRATFSDYNSYAKQTPKIIPRLLPKASLEYS